MTFDDLQATVCGDIGMSLESFYDATYRDICIIVHGYAERERRHQRLTLEAARLVSFYTVMPHVKKGSITKPTDLFLLPGESDGRKIVVSTDEDKKATFDRWDQEMKERHGDHIPDILQKIFEQNKNTKAESTNL